MRLCSQSYAGLCLVVKAAGCAYYYGPGLRLHTSLRMPYSLWLQVATRYVIINNIMYSNISSSYSNIFNTCRPGWSEGPTGKQLTADLKSRRAVATFADLGMPQSL